MYVYYFKKITTYTLLHGTRFDIELQGESVSTDILIFFFAQGEARWGEGGGWEGWLVCSCSCLSQLHEGLHQGGCQLIFQEQVHLLKLNSRG